MVQVDEIDTEALGQEINEIVLQEMVKWMMAHMPQETGALLASYINTLLLEADINSMLPYAANVDTWPPWRGWGRTKPTVNWTNPATIPHAKKAAWDYAESLVVPATQYVLQRHGLTQ